MLCNGLLHIDINLEKHEPAWRRVRGGKLLENGGDSFARAAPVCVEVDNGVDCRRRNGFKVRRRRNVRDFGHGDGKSYEYEYEFP